jgi:hypothetical protein
MLKCFGQIRPRIFETVILVGYAVLVASAIAHHEPWADEAQAWQLARNLSLHDLFVTYLHYEVHPILWYILLRTLNLGGISYGGMHWACGAIGIASTALFLFASPFPRYLKALLPFTYFLLFQYVVVARGYVLVPLILYLVAWRWKKGPAISIALLLGLLANVELHAAAISGGLAIVYCIEQLRCGSKRDPGQCKRLLGFFFVVLGFYAIAICAAWPARDLAHSHVIVWSTHMLIAAGQSVLWGVCEPLWLGFTFWVLCVLCLDERHCLIELLPVLCFAMFSVVYLSFWHAGLIVPLVICLLWISWPTSAPKKLPYETACRVALAAVAVVQILWSVNAIVYDHAHAYSGDRAAAEFLKPYVENGSAIITTYINQEDNHSYNAVGILPYFNQPVFANWQTSFWWASKRNKSDELYESILKSNPPMVLVETRQVTPAIPIDMDDPKIQSLLRSGYRATHVFCGTTPYRMSLGMTCCHLIMQYAGTSTPPTPTESH